MASDAGTRGQLLAGVGRVVIKIGSQLLAESPAGRPATIADEIHALRQSGVEVVLVSSGAIALGMRVLGQGQRPSELPKLQAAAAVGQSRLVRHWEHALATHEMHIAQVLLTHDDLSDRGRFINSRQVLRTLLEAGVVPIINENDTVAVDEIKYGDNDILAALVGNLVSADALIMLTDVDGLHDAPPNSGGRRIPVVNDVDLEAVPVATGPEPGRAGSGGMASKVRAAAAAARHGIITVVLKGDRPGVIGQALAGADVGTLFVPSAAQLSSHKHWLAYGARPAGYLVVDPGAHRAIAESGASLLPTGVVEVQGRFDQGDIVGLITPGKVVFARGLAGYSSDDIRRLAGCQTTDIEAILGYKYLDEVIHRDDLVVL